LNQDFIRIIRIITFVEIIRVLITGICQVYLSLDI